MHKSNYQLFVPNVDAVMGSVIKAGAKE